MKKPAICIELEWLREELRAWAKDIDTLAPHVGTANTGDIERAFHAARRRFERAAAAYADLLVRLPDRDYGPGAGSA